MAPPPVMVVIAAFGPPMATVVVGPTTDVGMAVRLAGPAIDERTISPVGGIVTPIRVMLPAEYGDRDIDG